MPFVMQRWFSLPRISAADLDGVRIEDDFLDDNVCETRWLLGSSARGNKTRYYVVGIPAASQSLNTGTREASVSDAAVHL